MNIDVVLGLQYGDEGKGKVTHSLLRDGDYTHTLRFNGGGNAGHTLYHEGRKFVTHLVPSGVFWGKRSIIGPGCVVNINALFKEIEYLRAGGIETDGILKIAKNAHIVTEDHIAEDGRDTKIGTTRTGNGPAYRDKYARTGMRAEDCPALAPYLVDMWEEFYGRDGGRIVLLAEGAQAFGLDIDWGDYPYVTSSHCGIGSLLLNGFNHGDIRNVYGVAKAYETYVGAKKFGGDDPIFDQIQSVGSEWGATTGRKRQVGWLNWDRVKKAVLMNGVNRLIVNKVDVLGEVRAWRAIIRGEEVTFSNEKEFCERLRAESESLWVNCKFSFSPTQI
jgi:adenylosuccinate synthase